MRQRDRYLQMNDKPETFLVQAPPVEPGQIPTPRKRRSAICVAISVLALVVVGAIAAFVSLWLWLFISLAPRPWVVRNAPPPALIAAAEAGDSEAISRLLDQGEFVDVQAFENADWPDGMTALMVAVHQNNRGLAELLLNKGATIALTTPMGDSAIHFSAPDTLHLLLGYGADINAKTIHGQTPLMLAAVQARETKDLTMVRMLLEAGADVNARDNYGRTTIGVLRTWPDPDPEAITLLQEAGGR